MTPVSDASSLVRFGIAGLAIAVAALFVLGVARAASALGEPEAARRRLVGIVALGAVAWMAVHGVLAARGVYASFDRRPPPLFLAMAATIALGAFLGLSGIGRRLATGLPLAALVAAQSFRLPLELVMREAAREGVMPVQMSLAGYNFDVVTGVTAILVAWLVARGRAPRWLVLCWNVLGSILLLVVGAIAIATTPVLHAFGPRALNTWVAHFPFVWLPVVLVQAALVGHIVVFRRLARG